MAKTIILGKTPYRVMKRSALSFSLQPIGSEYPHSLLLRDPPYRTKEPPARERWGHAHRGSNEVTWYRRISDDVFEKLGDRESSAPTSRRAHSTKTGQRGIPKSEAAALAKQIRAEVRRIGADVSVGRSGTGKYQTLELWGSDADAVAAQLERRGFARTPLSGLGTQMSPITLVRALPT